MYLSIKRIPQNIKLYLMTYGLSNYLFIFGWLGFIKYRFNKVISMDVKFNFFKMKSNTKFIFNTYYNLIKSFYNKVNSLKKKIIKINGVGFKCKIKQNYIYFVLGYSHLIKLKLCSNVKFTLIKNKILELSSIDRYLLNNYIYKIKYLKKFDVYKGKGFVLDSELQIRKEGKKATF